MGGLLRKLCIWICVPIYKLIKSVYWLFYNIANTRFLSNDIIDKLSANIYVLVSVIMLFSFAVTILSAIVNPDLLSDNKKGVSAIFKRSIVGLLLMVFIPFGFDELYSIQESVMSNGTIEKIIVGINISCADDSKCEAGGNGGQVIAGTLIASVLYPPTDSVGVNATDEDVSETYNKMVAEDIKYISNMASDINATRDGSGGLDNKALKMDYDDDAYAFHFDGLIAIVAGCITVYILLLFAMDVAVRVFKLAFLELTAPISIVGYIAGGDRILNSWLKELGKTYATLFIKIASMAFYLFLLNNLSEFCDKFTSSDYKFILKLFLVIGMLIFVKQIPDMIKNVFGIDIGTSKGGIGGRLGEMAGVGKVAQKAWGAVKNVAKAAPLAAGGLALSGVGAAAGAAAKGIGSLARVQKLKSAIGNTKAGAFIGKGANKISNLASTGASRVKAASKEDDPLKASKALLGQGKSKSEVKDAERTYANEQRQKESVRSKFAALTRDKNNQADKGIIDSDGKVISGQESRATTSAYASMINKSNNLSQSQKEAAIKYNEKQAALQRAKDDKEAVQKIQSAIRTRSESETGSRKTELSNIVTGMDAGAYKSLAELNAALSNAGIGESDALRANISEFSKNMSSKNLVKVESYSANVDKATEEFNRADSSLTDIINDRSTDSQKVAINEAKKISKNMVEAYADVSANNVQSPTQNVTAPTPSPSNVNTEAVSSPAQNVVAPTPVEHTSLQENIDRTVGVHDGPSREEHISRQDEYNSLFNSEAGSRYLDANEAEDDRIHGGVGAAAAAATGVVVGANSSAPVQIDGIDNMFNNLNKTIADTNKETNRILENQLNEQKNMNTELRNQSQNIKNLSNDFSSFNETIDDNMSKIKSSINNIENKGNDD